MKAIVNQIDGSSRVACWLAETPEGAFAKAAETDVQANLDAEIARQSRDGSWKPRGAWFGNYPESPATGGPWVPNRGNSAI